MDKNKCEVCSVDIKVQIYRGTGVCCENHRKLRDGEITLNELTHIEKQLGDARRTMLQ